MKKINIALYSFDELSPEVQKEIIEKERWNIMDRNMDACSYDYRNSLEEFSKIFDICCYNWSVGYCSYNYSFRIEKEEAFEWHHKEWEYIALEDLSGKLLMRYLQNNIISYIQKCKCFWKHTGVYPNLKSYQRYSRITKETDCPLTGYCYDMYLLEPVIEYLKYPDDTITYRQLMCKCLEQFFKLWHEEYEYWAENDNAIREELQNNAYADDLYHKNGQVYSGPLENVV